MKTDELVEFLGWVGTYARFRIRRGALPNGRWLDRIIVAHEGDWISEDAMECHSEYRAYEDVQKALGTELVFTSKEYSQILHRSLFSYSFQYGDEAILAVPATGEEIYFEIYGAEEHHGICLLVEREL